MRRIVALVAVAVVAAACSSSTSHRASGPTTTTAAAGPVWPAPPDPMGRAKEAGLVPEPAEQLRYHVHSHLDVFVDGREVTVPAGIGIDIHNPGVHHAVDASGDSYGGITVPCDQPCISPLHTHDTTGILHTESSTQKDNTLGQFLIEWNVTLPPGTKVYVDGKPFAGDPKTIPLSDRKEIAVVIGTPPADIPSDPGF
jgi:hypothetical protein